MRTKTKLKLCLSLIALLSACRVDPEVDATVRKNSQIASAGVEKAKLPDTPYNIDTVSSKNDIFLGNTSVKISDGDPLPARFEHDNGITLVGTKPVNLIEVAEQVSVLTGIPVRVDDLVLDKIKSGGDSSEVDTEAADEAMAKSEDENSALKYKIILSHSGKLSALLDQLAIRFSLWWRYKDGVVTFYEMENRIFTVYALPTTSKMNAELKSGGSASEGDSSASSNIGLQASADIELWKQIEDAIKGMVPKDAKISISQGTGTISVTAPPFTLKKVSKYINDLNLKLSRQVAIGVKVLRVELSKSDNYEANMLASFNDGNTNIQFRHLAEGLGMGSAKTLGVAIVDATSKWNNSAAVVKALSEQNDLSVVTTASVTTLNNKAAPVQVAQTISYIENIEIERDGSGTDATYTYSTEIGKVSNGFTMEVLPRIMDHGRLILLFSLSMTQVDEDSLKLQQIQIGKDTTSVTLPKLSTRSFIQEVALTSGSTLVLSGFEDVESATDRAGLGDAKFTALGGKANSNRKRQMIVVLLTPEVLASPLSPEARMNDI
ncbi:MAG: Outer membrane lipoprotein BfpB precursor [Firmicutes bacterium ADurb.Bin419]|nr:MAG: Outer membrane lipoprotein BfpB precursor [Firmicutes bacterium ADurb.Bin419]